MSAGPRILRLRTTICQRSCEVRGSLASRGLPGRWTQYWRAQTVSPFPKVSADHLWAPVPVPLLLLILPLILPPPPLQDGASKEARILIQDQHTFFRLQLSPEVLINRLPHLSQKMLRQGKWVNIVELTFWSLALGNTPKTSPYNGRLYSSRGGLPQPPG
jgi:hypothetical protein